MLVSTKSREDHIDLDFGNAALIASLNLRRVFDYHDFDVIQVGGLGTDIRREAKGIAPNSIKIEAVIGRSVGLPVGPDVRKRRKVW